MTFIKIAFLDQSLLLWIDDLYFDVICNIAVTFDALCILNFNALCI